MKASLRLTSVIAIVIALLPLIGSPAVTKNNEEKKEILQKCGDMEFRYTPEDGVALSVFGVPIIKGTSFWVMAPDWTERFYGAIDQKNLLKEATVEPFRDGFKIALHHYLSAEKQGAFTGTETFTLLPDNTYTVTEEFTFSQNVPAIFEWTIGNINPAPLIGKSYVATDDRITTRGVIPLQAASPDVGKSTIARAFKSIHIQSRIGPLEILTDPKTDVLYFDYRKNKWASNDNPLFWLGTWERPLVPGKRYSYWLTMRFPKKPNKDYKEIPVQSFPLPLKQSDGAQIPNWGQRYIIPTPKHLRYAAAAFPLSSKTRIYIGKKPGAAIENALVFFLAELKGLYQIEPQIIRDDPPQGASPDNVILLGEISRDPLPAQLCVKANAKVPDHEEGYALFVNDTTACVAAKTERGIFYGLTTLLQLVTVSEKGIQIRGAEIVDYPALPFRGIHCLSGKNAGDQIAKAVRTLMARFKINYLVWECEHIIWDSHPEIAHPEYGMTKKDAKKVVDAAKKCSVEIIPLVQSLGHSEWIFTNDQHLDIAEDPESRYAYSPTNPDTYKFIFSVFQEALDFFHPRYFHIGHDEVTMQGRFPARSKSSGKSATQLIMEDTQKLHDWLAQKGVKTILWGDMFLWKTEGTDACLAPSLEEAKKRRALLPKDAIVADWHYVVAKPEEYKSLKLWKDQGFQAVGAGWSRPENIRNLAKACVDYDALGYLQTTWAGFNFKIDNNENAWHQYWAYIWAAHYAWTGENTPPDELPFSAQQLFLDLWFERKPILKKRSGFMIDLRPLCNRRLDDAQRSGWVGFGPDLDFSSFPTEQNTFGETQFLVQKNDRREAAVMLAGKWNPAGAYPSSVEIPLGDTTITELHLLLTASFRTNDDTEVGELIAKYKDGSTDTMKLIYGKNIFAFDDLRTGKDTRIAWRGKTKTGTQIHAWDTAWKNPHPGKKLAAITLHSNGTEAAPILLAITGVN